MKDLTPNRGYLLQSDIKNKDGQIELRGNQHVYCERIVDGKAYLWFNAGDDFLKRCRVELHRCQDIMRLAKFVDLPEPLKLKFNIMPDGSRFRFTKGGYYRLTDDMPNVAQAGTLLRCITGGMKATMAFINDSGTPMIGQAARGLFRFLEPAEQAGNSLDDVKVELSMARRDEMTARLTLSGLIKMGRFTLSVERPNRLDRFRIHEPTPGGINAIALRLRGDLKSQGVSLDAGNSELIEAFVHFSYYAQGLKPFADVAQEMLAIVAFNRKQVEQDIAYKAGKTPYIAKKSDKRMRPEAFRNMNRSRSRRAG